MFRFAHIVVGVCVFLVGGCASQATKPTNAELQRQVADTERAFAKTMADRNYEAFTSFVSPEAVFFSDPKALRGKDEITTAWKPFFAKPEAAFSWAPEKVEVLDSGTLALSTGPVHDAKGKLIATYNSIWRKDAANSWHIIFDRGVDACECQAH
jgi:ketosteroid isomerase-like protein